MEATDRFAALMAAPEDEIPLDRAALLIAAHGRPGLDVEAELARLDDLAAPCLGGDLERLADHLFGALGFSGNAEAYYDERNSYLDHVVESRRGIPISLSVLTIAVGARCGVDLVGIGMPGHFLVRLADDPDAFLDPFNAGVRLDSRACRHLFEALHGSGAAFHPAHLAPVGPRNVAARMLANLAAIFRASGDAESLVWALRLRTTIPGIPAEERAQLADALVATGRFGAAAGCLDELAALGPPDAADRHRAAATRLRARLN